MVFSDPITCVQCSAGLIYNSVTGSCQCQTGYYSVAQVSTNYTQCYPCFAPLCQSCNASSPTVCNSCVTGASVVGTLCTCNSGYYQNGSLCVACPYKCLTCSLVQFATPALTTLPVTPPTTASASLDTMTPAQLSALSALLSARLALLPLPALLASRRTTANLSTPSVFARPVSIRLSIPTAP